MNHIYTAALALFLLASGHALADEPLVKSPVSTAQDANAKRLQQVGTVTHANLQSVVGLEISKDGKYLYASAYASGAISIFSRDQTTGELSLMEAVVDKDNLLGMTDMKVSPNGLYALASAFHSRAAVLYKREPATGKLTQISVAKDAVGGVTGLEWAVRGVFSPDSKFVYVANSGRASQNEPKAIGTVTAFRINEGAQLEFLEANQGEDNCFSNARGLLALSDGKTLCVASSAAGTLVVLDRDASTGKTSIRQIIKDETQGVHGLSGAMFVACSPDEKFIYTSSGRFQGDQAVGVYAFDAAGKLHIVQELINGRDGFEDFKGGNQLTVSPDGRNVYAVATISGTLSIFERDIQSGKLRFVESLQADDAWSQSVAGVCVSPDSKFVYVSGGERKPSITIFRRMEATR